MTPKPAMIRSDIYTVVAIYSGGVLSQPAADWTVSNGSAAPEALYAYLDSTGTNVFLSWTSVQGASGYLVQKSDYYGEDYYYQIAEVGSVKTSFEDTNGTASALDGIGSLMYEVQAEFPHGGLSAAVTTAINGSPPAPAGLTATVDFTGTNVLLFWTPAPAPATNYIIERGTYNQSTGAYSYSQIGTVGSGTNSFKDVGAFGNSNDNNDTYEVFANYEGGVLSSADFSGVAQNSAPINYNINVTTQLVRNETGHWQLMFSSIPTNVTAIAFYWYFWDLLRMRHPALPTTTHLPIGLPRPENDIPTSSITNGIFTCCLTFLMTNVFPNNYIGKVAMVQPIATGNRYGKLTQLGFQSYDSPTFVDGRQHMKQNLYFELRAAGISQQYSLLAEQNVFANPYFGSVSIPADTDYVEGSIFHWIPHDQIHVQPHHWPFLIPDT